MTPYMTRVNNANAKCRGKFARGNHLGLACVKVQRNIGLPLKSTKYGTISAIHTQKPYIQKAEIGLTGTADTRHKNSRSPAETGKAANKNKS